MREGINISKPASTISNHLVHYSLSSGMTELVQIQERPMIFINKKREFCQSILLLGLFSLCIVFLSGIVSADADEIDNSLITFHLTDTGDDTILRVSLMKEGESFKNGMARQEQDIEFIRERNEIRWNPCNDNACMVFSSKSAGGKTGRDQLILTITYSNPKVDVTSCSGDPTCERLKGGTYTKSGMLDGILYTGKTYAVSVSSLKAGIGEAFEMQETQT